MTFTDEDVREELTPTELRKDLERRRQLRWKMLLNELANKHVVGLIPFENAGPVRPLGSRRMPLDEPFH